MDGIGDRLIDLEREIRQGIGLLLRKLVYEASDALPLCIPQ